MTRTVFCSAYIQIYIYIYWHCTLLHSVNSFFGQLSEGFKCWHGRQHTLSMSKVPLWAFYDLLSQLRARTSVGLFASKGHTVCLKRARLSCQLPRRAYASDGLGYIGKPFNVQLSRKQPPNSSSQCSKKSSTKLLSSAGENRQEIGLGRVGHTWSLVEPVAAGVISCNSSHLRKFTLHSVNSFFGQQSAGFKYWRGRQHTLSTSQVTLWAFYDLFSQLRARTSAGLFASKGHTVCLKRTRLSWQAVFQMPRRAYASDMLGYTGKPFNYQGSNLQTTNQGTKYRRRLEGSSGTWHTRPCATRGA